MDPYVLVVDDHPDVRQLIMDVLETMRVPGREANNGQEALRIVSENVPSAIILDLMMPVMNGFSVLTSLYNHKGQRGIPVILLSGLSSDDDQLLALPGVVGVLKKGGFTIEELRTMLTRALSRTQALAGQ